jgi:hypothetical protein
MLAEKYGRLWAVASDRIVAGTYAPDPIPVHGDPRWGLSLVALVDGAAGENIASDLVNLAASLGSQHFVYTRGNLHLTIRSLEGFQNEVPEEQVEFYYEQTRLAVDDCGQLDVRLCGMGGSAGGIFVKGYPSAGVQNLRVQLDELAQSIGPQACRSNDYRAVRDTAHVSLAVFRAPATPEPRLVDFVAARSRKDYGVLSPLRLALVSYDFSTGSMRMSVIRTFEDG